jgi:hypothetical protein
MDRALREQKPAHCTWTLLIDQRQQYFDVRVAYLRSDRVLVIVRDSTAHHEALQGTRIPAELPVNGRHEGTGST